MHFILVSNRDRMWIKFIPAESSDFNLFTFVILSCTIVSFFWDPSQFQEFKWFNAKKSRPLIGQPDRSANQRPIFFFGGKPFKLMSWLRSQNSTYLEVEVVLKSQFPVTYRAWDWDLFRKWLHSTDEWLLASN